MLQLVSHHVIKNQEISLKKFRTELQRVVGLHQILAGNVYMLRTTTELSIPFQVLKEIFLALGLKKVQKQDLKNIKNVKGCRDGMPKSMQTRQG